MVWLWWVDANRDVFETIFSLEMFHGNVTGKLIFDIMNENLYSLVNIKKLAGVCTVGSNAMTGKYEVIVCIRQNV